MRLADWALALNGDAVYRSTWMGVPALKNPLDAWIYQEIVHETRPQAIVELGSAEGGGALYLAHLLELAGGDGRVISVDVSRESYDVAHPRIVEVTGRTGDPEVIERVRELCEGRRTMVIHDASHRAHAVYADLQAYAPLVSPGCYLIVEDGIGDVMPKRKLPEDPGAGPYLAVKSFLADGAPFEVDPDRERFLMTNNPRGYLKRR
jgi:cephalosporin hydroxylase